MTISDHFGFLRSQKKELHGTMAISAVAAMIGVLFAGSTVVTPLYVIYKQQFGFSQISLTLIYAAYVLGNLAALLLFGRLSDEIGRRRTAVTAWRSPSSAPSCSCSLDASFRSTPDASSADWLSESAPGLEQPGLQR